MVSNAFLLSQTNAEVLRHLRINTIQITIDGIAETHNIYRPLVNSQPTWERIIKNLEQAISILGGISIRCNVDKKNIFSAYKLADYLYERDILNKTHFYLGKIDKSEFYNSEILFSNYEFSLVEFQFKKYLYTKYQYGTLLPKQKFIACSACAYNHYVINYNGDIYQCLNDIGDTEKMLSNILSENLMKDLIYSRNYQKYILNDFFHDKNCKECQFLPACMGGCPHDREVNDYGSCKGLKDILPQIIQTTMEEKGGYHEVSS